MTNDTTATRDSANICQVHNSPCRRKAPIPRTEPTMPPIVLGRKRITSPVTKDPDQQAHQRHCETLEQVCQPEDEAPDGTGHPDKNPYIQDNPGLVRTPVGAIVVLAQQSEHPRPAYKDGARPHPHTPTLLQPTPQHELQKEEHRGQRSPHQKEILPRWSIVHIHLAPGTGNDIQCIKLFHIRGKDSDYFANYELRKCTKSCYDHTLDGNQPERRELFRHGLF